MWHMDLRVLPMAMIWGLFRIGCSDCASYLKHLGHRHRPRKMCSFARSEDRQWAREKRCSNTDAGSSDEDVDELRAPSVATVSWDFERLQGYLKLASVKGLCDSSGSSWATVVAVANLAQRAEFSKQVSTSAMPAILRRSALVDLVQLRRYLVSELWLAQGYPYPGLLRHSLDGMTDDEAKLIW